MVVDARQLWFDDEMKWVQTCIKARTKSLLL